MCEYEVLDSCVRGHHVYKNYKSTWAPAFGETLAYEVEFGNIHDPSAVAVRKLGVGESSFETVGHVTRKISALRHFYIKRAGIIISSSSQ